MSSTNKAKEILPCFTATTLEAEKPPTSSAVALEDAPIPIQPRHLQQRLPFFVYGTLCSGFLNWEHFIKVTVYEVYGYYVRVFLTPFVAVESASSPCPPPWLRRC
jgi:hypothetical protein